MSVPLSNTRRSTCARRVPRACALALTAALAAQAGCVADIGGDAGDGALLSETSGQPAPYLTMLYTEALGRAPDASGWQAYLGYFRSNGCNHESLRFVTRSIFLSAEYQRLSYGHVPQLLTLYRAILGREPDPGGFANHHAAMRSGRTLAESVDVFTDSAEFRGRVGAICSGQRLGWGRAPVIDVPVGNTGNFGGSVRGQTQNDLEAQLAAAAANGGGTVLLERRAVVRLTRKLQIPANVTLKTEGNQTRNRYAAMGRLVRTTNVGGGGLVSLAPGARLIGVWVDGQNGKWDVTGGRTEGVRTLGSNIQVLSNRLSDSMGTQVYLADGSRYNISDCTDTIVRGNLITAYPSRYHQPTPNMEWYSDGVTNRCRQATIDNNHIVDVTDIGIVTFHPGDSVHQRSQVRNNRIVNAGNNAVAGLGIDPETGWREQAGTVHSFEGFVAEGNALWTSAGAHIGMLVTAGTRGWFPDGVAVGGTVRDNDTSGLTARTNAGSFVATMNGPAIQGNTFDTALGDYNGCPVGAVVVSTDSTNTGNVQGPVTTADPDDIVGCVSQ